MNKRVIVIAVIAVGILVVAIGRWWQIQPVVTPVPTLFANEVEVEFVSIKANTAGYIVYDGMDPRLIVLTQPEDSARLGETISPNAQLALREIDFQQDLAIAVFQGCKGSGGYAVLVRRITVSGSTLIVYAHFQNPGLPSSSYPGESILRQ